MKKAREAIVNTVPEEGRGIFKGGLELHDSDIEPFDDHDDLMEKAHGERISVNIPYINFNGAVDNAKVIETWDSFKKTFKTPHWGCSSKTPFRWQHGQKVWLHLMVLFVGNSLNDIPREMGWVRVSSIVDHLDDIDLIRVFSFLRHRHKQFGLHFDIP